jgi:hypothetical protein
METEHISIYLKKAVVRASFIFGGILTLIELCCYLTYFHFIYNHDNTVAITVISKSSLKSRNKTNAISMGGQVASWVMEIWYIVLVGLLSTMFQVELLREVSVIIKASDYFLIPLVQILTSAPIKRNFKEKS